MTMIQRRDGCKVGWKTFDDEGEAHEESARAVEQGRIFAASGYDFGYETPGRVQDNHDGTWTVTIP